MIKNNEIIEGLVVLEYLNMGIMPFYPSNPGLTTADKKAKRKFRKLWRKIASNRNILEYYVALEGKTYPSKAKLWKRKTLVHKWITDNITRKYGINTTF
tara:strand:- start:2109 stop:2405 length:297 start_codon:yes stop_codon:yes gene_type:complete